MGIRDMLRGWREGLAPEVEPGNGRHPLPDPGKVPMARGSWEQAALTNVDITEVVKRQLGTVTPPWKK